MIDLIKSFPTMSDKLSIHRCVLCGLDKFLEEYSPRAFLQVQVHVPTVVPNDDARHVGQHEVGTTHAYLPLSKAVLQSQDLSQSLDLKTVRCSTGTSLVPQVQIPRTSGVSFEKRFVGKGKEDLGDVQSTWNL
jgi:hypothetical protein